MRSAITAMAMIFGVVSVSGCASVQREGGKVADTMNRATENPEEEVERTRVRRGIREMGIRPTLLTQDVPLVDRQLIVQFQSSLENMGCDAGEPTGELNNQTLDAFERLISANPEFRHLDIYVDDYKLSPEMVNFVVAIEAVELERANREAGEEAVNIVDRALNPIGTLRRFVTTRFIKPNGCEPIVIEPESAPISYRNRGHQPDGP